MRRVVATFGAVAVGVGLVVLAAVPVHASTNLGTVTWNGTTLSNATLTGTVGDQFTMQSSQNGSVRNDTGAATSGGLTCSVPGGIPNCAAFSGIPVSITVTQEGRLAFWTGTFIGYITISSGSGSSPTVTEHNSAPAPIVQQFAKPVAGECDAAQPAGLDWSGVASGGWTESWAQWANAGKGGTVCTRMLEYSSALGRWVIG